MRTLSAAPPSFLDPATGAPAFGSYAGPLPRIELGGSALDRLRRRKKWVWLGLATDEIWLSFAIVRMGYAANAFAFAFDRRSGRLIADRTVVGPPQAAKVSDAPHDDGTLARFALGGSRVTFARRGAQCDLRARFGGIDLEATLDESSAPPPIAAIVPLDGASSSTEKRALTSVRGSVVLEGRRFSLDGALGGYDYTQGSLPRHTRWRWAFALGRARDGQPIAFNVVHGFVGEPECAAFTPDGVFPLVEPRIEYDDPHRRWRILGEGIDLTFDVGAVHEQHTNLVVVRSRFLQPVGTFRGSLNVAGRTIELDGVPGVVEDQDVLW